MLTQTLVPEPAPLTNTILITESIDLILDANPAFVTPGRNAFIDWEIVGFGSIPESLNLVFHLPAGFSPHPSQDGVFDPNAMTYTLEVDRFNGKVHWRTDGLSMPPYLLTAELFLDGRLVTDSVFEFNDHTSHVIQKSGGQAVGLNGKVTVMFPEDSISEDIILTIRDAAI